VREGEEDVKENFINNARLSRLLEAKLKAGRLNC